MSFEGRVKWFNKDKGYGFITNDNGQDIFVHYSGIKSEGYRTMEEGERVSFDEVKGEKGFQAENVVKLD